MDDSNVSFLNTNKKLLLISTIFAIVFTVFGGGRIFALIVYSFIISLFAIKYQKVLESSPIEDRDGNISKQRTFSKFILKIFVSILVFAIVFTAGVLIKNRTGLTVPFFTKSFLPDETLTSFLGSAVFAASFVVLLFKELVKLFIKKSDFKKMLIFLSTIYIPVLYIPCYLVFLTLARFSKNVETAHIIFLSVSGLVFVFAFILSLCSISKTRKTYLGESFVKKPKRKSIFKI